MEREVIDDNAAAGDIECIDTIELRVPCKPEYIRVVRLLAASIAESIPMSPDSVYDLQVAVSEAVSNVVRHAYRGACPEMPIDVVFRRGKNEIAIDVMDAGIGFEPPAEGPICMPEPGREGGLGITLMRQLMDGVDFSSQAGVGTRISMTKKAAIGDC